MYHHQRAATFNDDWQDWPPDMSSDTSSEFKPALWPARHADAPMVRKNRPSRPPDHPTPEGRGEVPAPPAKLRRETGRDGQQEVYRPDWSAFSASKNQSCGISYARNEEIFGEGEPAEYVYQVVSGAARTYKVLSDGRRQIGAFYLPGGVFGLGVGDLHHCSAEAISKSTILVIKRNTLIARADTDHQVAHLLWTLTAQELRRVQEHMLLLIRCAQERVACFLLEMAERLAQVDVIDLPMSRQDIADYLGLTIETISRTLTQLETEAAISVPTCRHIILINRKALQRLQA